VSLIIIYNKEYQLGHFIITYLLCYL